MQDALSAVALVEKATDLPAIPGVVAEVLRLAADPIATIADVCRVLERDPALTAKLLKVANSPYYGMRQHVGSLKLALVILGMREVRNIILGVSVVDAIRSDEADQVLSSTFWRHAVLVATLVRRMEEKLTLRLEGEAFVSGLLHDIGKAIMARQFGSEYRELAGVPNVDPDAYCTAEVLAFGFSHADAAAALAIRWSFPQSLSDALWMHHAVPGVSLEQAGKPVLAAAVRLANSATHLDAPGAEPGRILDRPADVDAWRILARVDASITPESGTRLFRESQADIGAAPPLPF